MSFFDFFKGKNKKDSLQGMGRRSKKKFLSNDLIERMIRVEQSVSASLGESKLYSDTEYYKSLRKNEKDSLNKYLKKKKTSKVLLMGLLLAILLISGLKFKFTGDVVRENIGNSAVSGGSFVLIGVVLVGLFLLAISLISGGLRERRFKKNFKILEGVCLRREFGNFFG